MPRLGVINADKNARDIGYTLGMYTAPQATPDVAGLAEGYQVFTGPGQIQSVGGTSASTPMFGAVVSLLNEARMAGRNPLLTNRESAREHVMGCSDTPGVERGSGHPIVVLSGRQPAAVYLCILTVYLCLLTVALLGTSLFHRPKG